MQFLFFHVDFEYCNFSCLISVAKSSRTMLHTSDRNGHSCLVPDHKEKTFSISPLSSMLVQESIIYGLYYVGVEVAGHFLLSPF